MTTRLSPFHPLSWPLWLKFLIGIVVGLTILAIPALIFVQSGVYDISLQNAKSFVSETGVRHATLVDNALIDARTRLSAFASDSRNSGDLIGYLLRDVRTDTPIYLPKKTANDIVTVFRDELISLATSPFESVRLLDRSGRVVVQANVSSASFLIHDESQAPAYRAALNAQLQGQSSAIAVTEDATPAVEIINAIYWRDGSPIGYIVARLSRSRIFLNNIRVDQTSNNFSAYTFLTTARDAVVTTSALLTEATAASQSPAVTRALGGQTGVDSYQAGNGVDYIGYYTEIVGTPFVLVTQAPAETVYANTLTFFQVRTFVVIIALVALVAILVVGFNQLITPSLNRLRRAAQALSNGDFDLAVPDVVRGDEVGLLAAAFINMRDQVRVLIGDLEDRIATRTRDIGATQDISRYAATQRDVQILMNRVVDLIVERFPDIYHAQIFLIDDAGANAVLRASTGAAGQQLLSRGHRLGVGSLSVIGQVAQQGHLIIARDTVASQVHRRNEFLQETRAELAIPLRIGETVIGALDVQSRVRDAFDEDLVSVLQTMADQIAVAIQNARLYEESLRRVREIEENNRTATRRAWQEFMRDQRAEEIVKTAGFSTGTDLAELRETAVRTGKPAVGTLTERQTIPVAVPVQLRGQTLGAVEWEIPAAGLSEEKIELAQELANRLALSLDNARLFQESQRTTERERLVNSIATKLTAQTTINDILETAVREVGQALRAPQVSIRLQTLSGIGNGNGNGNDNGDHPKNDG